jgi:hypothetical protein
VGLIRFRRHLTEERAELTQLLAQRLHDTAGISHNSVMAAMTFFSPGAKADDVSQSCPICGGGQPQDPRYPNYVCSDCVGRAVDEEGRRLAFGNLGIGGGFVASYVDSKETRDSHVCFVDGIRCWADEARFGGIVVQRYGEHDEFP